MDVQRRRAPRRFRFPLIGLGLCAVLGVSIVSLRGLEPRPESVRRAVLTFGRVERGPFIVRVKGSGTLVPEAVRWLTAESSGRVEEVLVRAGANVRADTPVVRLENLDLRLEAVRAEHELASAESRRLALERELGEQELVLESVLASTTFEAEEATRRAQVYAQGERAFVSTLDARQAAARASELMARSESSRRRLDLLRISAAKEQPALAAQIARLREVTQVRRELVDHLLVRGQAEGTIEDVLVELGQWVVPGTPVARVIISRRLAAKLSIAEQEAVHLALGQPALLGSPSGELPGHVRRIAAAARQGYVDVEIALDGEAPDGLRPNQGVYGQIEVERSESVLSLPRPMGAEASSRLPLFRANAEGDLATRVWVQTGRVSVDRLEVRAGLEAGDEVILSDLSRQRDRERLRIE